MLGYAGAPPDEIRQVAHHRGDAREARTRLAEGLTLSLETGTRRTTATGLVGLALLSAAHGQAARATPLLGTAAALYQTLGVPVEIQVQADYAWTLALVRGQLGADAFAVAWAAGQATPMEQTAATALAPAPPGPASVWPKP